MTVGKVKDFSHPSAFGFTGSAGSVPVRGHMRGLAHGGQAHKSHGHKKTEAHHPGGHPPGHHGGHHGVKGHKAHGHKPHYAQGGRVEHGEGGHTGHATAHTAGTSTHGAKPFAKGGQLSDAFKPSHKGRLHKALGVKPSQKIPGKKMREALSGKDGAHVEHMAQAAHNMAEARKHARGGHVKPRPPVNDHDADDGYARGGAVARKFAENHDRDDQSAVAHDKRRGGAVRRARG